jgi:TolB-like protein/Tfp pilus assembly protein PilF
VLPFVNVSGDSANEHLSDGLTDELTNTLSRVEGLRVAPRTVTIALKRAGLDARTIADTLGVATVVEGTVHRDGDRLKVNAHLVNAREGTVLWSETFDREPHEFLAVQEEIARAIVGALYPQEPTNARAALAGTRSNDAEAYDLYLRGRHSWKQRTREGLQQAVVFYEGAVERDPTFAMAYVGLAEAYVNLSNFGYRDLGEALARAGVAADRALALAPQLAETNASKGFVLAARQDFRASEAAFRRAIQLNPSYTWAHHYYTQLLLMLGRTDEALEQNRQALAADPLSLPANAMRGIVLLQRGDYPAADRELQRALALSPDFPLTLYYLAVVHAAQRQYADAGRLLERAALQAPDFTGMPGARALVFQRTGRQQVADSLLAEVEAKARTGDARARANLAFAHAALGRMDAAFALFDQVQWDVPALIELRADPLLQPMRSNPRYPILLQKIGAGR